jgi:Icc-related predicted phosphoesterase
VILGNDDPRCEERALVEAAAAKVWDYAHGRRLGLGSKTVFGYACIPPTPFLLKDWERYDVSRFVDPGCVSPEEGWRSVPQPAHEIRYGTIQKDLAALTAGAVEGPEIFLFHAPPYGTSLDRAGLDNRMVDHVPVDLHVGSIAIRDLIVARQPALTLHGHVHESARLTGTWKQTIGSTVCINAAHDGPELSLVRVDLDTPAKATRELL